MNNLAAVMAKLAATRKAAGMALNERTGVGRGDANGKLHRSFQPSDVGDYFTQTARLVDELRTLLPELYQDFREIQTTPTRDMLNTSGAPSSSYYAREQLDRLTRDIDHVLEIRSNSELSQPSSTDITNRVFVSHGRSNDWREVQQYIERDIGLETIELAQEPNLGRTIIEKLEANAARCDSAVIVMTGDDFDSEGQARARENVMHEVGFFQGRYGRSRVCLLHEEGVSIPTNISGVVYSPFRKGSASSSFGVLFRELKAMYRLSVTA